MSRTVLLSFDFEEFDVPKEHNVPISLEEGIKVSVEGANRILDVLEKNEVKATFFCTGNFATFAPSIMHRLIKGGHEIACHGVDHWQPKETDIRESKRIVEQATGVECHGYRQPRMFPVNDADIKQSGYRYNSSLNPAFIPGRYMHLTSSRTWFIQDGVYQIPASVTPIIRFPLFWLSLHNLPEKLYFSLVKRVLKHDGYFVTYFHPWEFYDLLDHPEYKMPFYIKKNSGTLMANRLDHLIQRLKGQHCDFMTMSSFIDNL